MDDINRPQNPPEGRIGSFVGIAFFLLAGWFLLGPDLNDIPDSKSVSIHKDHLSTAPRRKMLGDPPFIEIDGFSRTCAECHKLFPARDETPEKLLKHAHIVLDHGINDRCRNCHDTKDRDRLLLHSGESIPYKRVIELCAKCHGPTYRDWQLGMHGRTNGFWDATRGEMRRLDCTECHDPHNPRVPAMDPVMPLPPPYALRAFDGSGGLKAEGGGRKAAGDFDVPVGDFGEADPLRKALQRVDRTAFPSNAGQDQQDKDEQ